MDTKANAHTVDLSNDDRGIMFNPDEEAKAAGWGTDDPYVCLEKLYDGPPRLRTSSATSAGLVPKWAWTWVTPACSSHSSARQASSK